MTLHECVQSAELQIKDMQRAIEVKDSEIYRMQCQVRDLQEQLQIARTATNDTEEFRQRERKHAEAVMTGYSLAIHAMVAGLKGGK